ncbi:MAG: transposase, partial [Acidobacteriota bacterium]|nr:transposase [Acidobacteriota bacterium]
RLRRVKYLNNVIEQDHRFVKKKVRAAQCFKSFYTAERTIEGIEAVNMIRKGQVKRLLRFALALALRVKPFISYEGLFNGLARQDCLGI